MQPSSLRQIDQPHHAAVCIAGLLVRWEWVMAPSSHEHACTDPLGYPQLLEMCLRQHRLTWYLTWGDWPPMHTHGCACTCVCIWVYVCARARVCVYWLRRVKVCCGYLIAATPTASASSPATAILVQTIFTHTLTESPRLTAAGQLR